MQRNVKIPMYSSVKLLLELKCIQTKQIASKYKNAVQISLQLKK